MNFRVKHEKCNTMSKIINKMTLTLLAQQKEKPEMPATHAVVNPVRTPNR